MKKIFFVGLIICLSCATFWNADCAQESVSVSEAIKNAQTLKTVKEKVDYLIKQAEVLYNSKNFQQAIDLAQYVLSKLDTNSLQAKDLIERAKAQLQAVAQKTMGDVGNKLFGK